MGSNLEVSADDIQRIPHTSRYYFQCTDSKRCWKDLYFFHMKAFLKKTMKSTTGGVQLPRRQQWETHPLLPSKLSMAESRTMDKPSRCLNAHRQVKRFQSSAGWGRLTWFWASRWATERKIWNQISTRVGPFIDTSETNDKELLWSTFSLSGSCKLSTHSEEALQMTVPDWNNGKSMAVMQCMCGWWQTDGWQQDTCSVSCSVARASGQLC